MKPSRRSFLLQSAAGVALARSSVAAAAAARLPVTVWKSPSCGCCTKWVAHLQAAGFQPSVQEVDDIERVKADLGVPADVASCHTALVGGYVIEGHVPAGAIDRLLAERPHAKGLAVPGMPQGAPGMETGIDEAYEVLLLTGTGRTVFERYKGALKQ